MVFRRRSWSKVGVARLAELARAERLALAACTNCGRCDDVCPAFAAGTDLSPRRLVQTLRTAELGGDLETDLLADGRISAGELWACTTCGACVEACPFGARRIGNIKNPNDPVTKIIMTQRVGVLKEEYGTKPQVFYIGLSKEVK